jgi:hypothetical protein
MKTLSEIMSNQSKEEYLNSCRVRYPSRNRKGRSLMIDEVSDTLGWNRKHTIKALNGQVSKGIQANKRGSKPIYTEIESEIIIYIWKRAEQPCSIRLKEFLPLWLPSYEKRHGKLDDADASKILKCSPRQLDRITKPHRLEGVGRLGRKTGRRSHRLKQKISIFCGPWDVDSPGWMECDTVAHGGGCNNGNYMHTLTMTDIYSGWTEVNALLGLTAGATCQAARIIENRLPFDLFGFDSDNGSEFLNETLEKYLLTRTNPVRWTRSRPYKKNDQAHVEQKNFTHVRQLLGYTRYEGLEILELVNDLYVNTWLPLKNNFMAVMKLIKKERINGKFKKTYDEPSTPCDRMLGCPKVSEDTKLKLRTQRAKLDPLTLSDELESKLSRIFKQQDEDDKKHAEEAEWEQRLLDGQEGGIAEISGFSSPPVAIAPSMLEKPEISQKLAK